MVDECGIVLLVGVLTAVTAITPVGDVFISRQACWPLEVGQVAERPCWESTAHRAARRPGL